MPISSRLIPTVMTVAAASQFTRPGARTGDSGIHFQVAAAAISVTISGIQKSQCQPRCCAISAPSTRPQPPPTPRIEDIRPMLPATRSVGNSSRAIENASGKMPPATPWITRAKISIPSESETRGEQRAGREDQQRPQQQLLLAVHVPEAPDHRGADRGGQQERGQQPGRAGLRGVERVLEGRQRRDDRRGQDRVGEAGRCRARRGSRSGGSSCGRCGRCGWCCSGSVAGSFGMLVL